MSGVRDRKRKMVAGLNEMYMENYRKAGAEFILGTGRFVASRTVEVDLHDGSTRQLRGMKLRIERTYSLSEAAQARCDLESRKTAGKLLHP
jgi:hypothetical protein